MPTPPSRFLHHKKTLTLALLFVLIYLSALIGLLYLVERVFRSAPFESTLNTAVFISVNTIAAAAFLIYRSRTKGEWIQREANSWLELRAQKRSDASVSRRKVLKTALLWSPSLIAIIAFFFLPEIAGVASHLWQGRTVNLGPYELKTPLTWFVSSYFPNDFYAISFPGIGVVGLRPYLRKEIPLAEMSIYEDSEPATNEVLTPEALRASRTLGQRTVLFVDQELRCVEYLPIGHPPDVPGEEDLRIACTTASRRIWARFYGRRQDAAAFYATLKTVRRVK